MTKFAGAMQDHQRKLISIRKHLEKFVGAIQDHLRKLDGGCKHITKFCDAKSEENCKITKES